MPYEEGEGQALPDRIIYCTFIQLTSGSLAVYVVGLLQLDAL